MKIVPTLGFHRPPSGTAPLMLSPPSNARLWLDASDASTITTGSTFIWADKSGNGHHATQSSVGSQPSTGTRVLNGLNALKFDGTNDTLALPSGAYSISNGDYTVFLVQAIDVSGNYYTFNGANGGQAFGLTNFGTGEINVSAGASGGPPNLYVTPANTSQHVIGFFKEGTRAAQFRDGEVNSLGVGANFTMANLYIGSNGSAAYFNGLIAEILVYARKLSVSEMNQAGNYLRQKWGTPWMDIAEEGTQYAATYNALPDARSQSPTYTHEAVYIPFRLGEDMSSLTISDSNIFFINTGENGIGNDYTIVEASVVSPTLSLTAPVLYGASRTQTLSNTACDRRAVRILPAQFGLSHFAKGSLYYYKAKLSVASAGQYFPQNSALNPNDIGNSAQGIRYNPANTIVSTVDAVGPFTHTGTAPASSGGSVYRPLILGTPVSGPSNVVVAIGTSISAGAGDATSLDGGGHFQRAVIDGGNYLPSLNMGVGARDALTFNNGYYWKLFLKYGPSGKAYVEEGTNDIQNSTTPTLATLTGRLDTLWTTLKRNGYSKIIAGQLLANVTSTDSYVTTANQTTKSGWGAGENASLMNAYLATKLGDGTIQAVTSRSALVDGTASEKWAVNGSTNYMTGDGVHPNQTGHGVLKTSVRSAINSL